MQQGHSDSDKEETMSISQAGANLQRGDSDEESSATFETVGEKDVGLSSKRNRQEETGKPCHKIKREEEKSMSSEMELMISQLTTIVKQFEEHEFWNIAEVLDDNPSDKVDGVIANMICLVETSTRCQQSRNPFMKN